MQVGANLKWITVITTTDGYSEPEVDNSQEKLPCKPGQVGVSFQDQNPAYPRGAPETQGCLRGLCRTHHILFWGTSAFLPFHFQELFVIFAESLHCHGLKRQICHNSWYFFHQHSGPCLSMRAIGEIRWVFPLKSSPSSRYQRHSSTASSLRCRRAGTDC